MNFLKSISNYFNLSRKVAKKAEEVIVEEDTKPKAEFIFIDGKIEIKNYNKAFVADLRVKLGTIGDGKSDSELVKSYLNRENLEREEPKLDVVHMGIASDGSIKMKLDWNRSFINHLRENGIEGETEEVAVQKYLALLTHEISEVPYEENAFADIDAQLGVEFEAAKKQSNNRKVPRRRQMRGENKPDMTDSF